MTHLLEWRSRVRQSTEKYGPSPYVTFVSAPPVSRSNCLFSYFIRMTLLLNDFCPSQRKSVSKTCPETRYLTHSVLDFTNVGAGPKRPEPFRIRSKPPLKRFSRLRCLATNVKDTDTSTSSIRPSKALERVPDTIFRFYKRLSPESRVQCGVPGRKRSFFQHGFIT